MLTGAAAGFSYTRGSASAAAGINRQISFQGKLVNPNGTNVTDGSYSVVFSIYNVASGGSAIWSETQSVPVTNGIFQVNLGSVTALPGSVDFNTDNIFLGIKVGADAEMTPRVQFTAVPQAFNAEKLGGLDKTGFVQNQTGTAQAASFNISGTATVGTSLNSPLIQNAGTLTLAATGANALLFQTNGATRLTVDSSGNATMTGTLTVQSTGNSSFAGKLGIGTTTPAYPLDVQGGSGIVGQFSGRVIGANAVNTNEFATLGQVNSAIGGASGNYIQNSTSVQVGANFNIGGNGVVGGTLSVAGNITTGGLLIEKTMSFTPTAVGWYRVLVGSSTGAGTTGGVVRIVSAYDNRPTDVELSFDIGGYGTGGAIQQTRFSSYNQGAISQARISSDGAGAGYLDIYVATATAPGPITLYGYGPRMPNFVASPVVGAAAGSTSVSTLTLGHGFRTTAGANFAETAGSVGIGTNLPGYKLDVQGGTGIVGQFSGRVIGGNAVNGNEFATLAQVTGGSGNANYIFNGTGLQTNANFNIQSAAAGSAGGVIRGAAGQTADLFQIQNSAGFATAAFDAVGNFAIGPSADATSTTQNTSGNLKLASNYWNGSASVGEGFYLRDARLGANPGAPGAHRLTIGVNANQDFNQFAIAGDGSSTVSIGETYAQGGLGQLYVKPTATTRAGVVVRANSGQTADLFQSQNSAGTVLSKIDAQGSLSVGTGGGSTFFQNNGIAGLAAIFQPFSPSGIGVAVRGQASQTGDLVQLQNNVGTILTSFASDGSLRFSGTNSITSGGNLNLYANTTALLGQAAGSTVQIVRGAASQTADLFQAQNSAGTVLAKVLNDGSIVVSNGGDAVKLKTTGQVTTSYAGQSTMLGYSGQGASLQFGTADGVYDTSLYRNAANALRTGGSLLIDGSVGIGTTSPQQALTLGSSASFATNLATPGTPTLTTATTGGTLAAGTYYYKVTALSGSGETIPSAEASITTTGTTSTVTVSWPAVTGAASYRVYRGTAAGAENTYYTSTTTSFTDTGAAGTAASPPTVTTAYVNFINSNGNSYLLGGNVGIGTSSPSQKLDVNGTIRIGVPTAANGDYASTQLSYIDGGQGTFNIYGGRYAQVTNLQSGSATGTKTQFTFVGNGDSALGTRFIGYRPSDGLAGFLLSTGAENSYLNANGGNVGIGTTSPQANLSIGPTSLGTFNGISVGASYNQDIRIGQDPGHNLITAWKYNATAGSAYGLIETYAGTNNLTLQGTGGNVGVGTTVPAYKLDVQSGTGIVGQFSGRVIGGNAVNSNEFATLSQVTGVGGNTNYIFNGTALQSNANFNIQSAAAGSVGGIIRGAAGQTADLMQFQNSSGAVSSRFDAVGGLAAPYGRFGDGTMTSFGTGVKLGVITQGAANVGQVIQGSASQTADLLQLQNSAGTVLSRFDSRGFLTVDAANLSFRNDNAASFSAIRTTGTQTLEIQGSQQGATGALRLGNSVGGVTTLGLLYASQGIQVPTTLNQPIAGYDGTNGSTFGISGLGYASFGSGSASNSSTTVLQLNPRNATDIGVIVQGKTGQIADLFQLQNSAGTLLARFDNVGDLSTGGGVTIGSNTFGVGQLNVVASGAGIVGQTIKGFSGQTADLFQAQNSAGTVITKIDANGNITAPTVQAGNLRSSSQTRSTYEVLAGDFTGKGTLGAALTSTPWAPNVTGIAVQGASGQTADLFQLQNSAATAVAKFDANGNLGLGNGNALFNINGGLSAGGARVEEATTNLVTNPSFETGTGGWSGNTVTLATTTSSAYVGKSSLQATVTTAGASGPYASGNAVTAGATYTLSAYVRAVTVTGSPAIRAGIDWYNGATFISTSSGTPVTLSSAFQRVTITATAPAGATNAAPTLYTSTTSTVGDVYGYDAVQFEQKPYATTYADGSMGSGYAWTGAANASTSTRAAGGFVADNSLTSVSGGLNLQGMVTANGAGNNYFAGNVGIGTSSPTLGSIQVNKTDNNAVFAFTGQGSTGGYDSTNGVGLYLTYNTPSNRQFVIADTSNKLGVRYISNSLDGFNLATNSRQDLQIGTETNGAHVGGTAPATTTMFSVSNVAGTASKVVTVIQGASGQTGDLLQFQNSAGALLSGINNAGGLFFANSGFYSTLNTGTLTASRVINLPDANGTVCLQNSSSCGFATSSGSGNYIQNGTALQSGANFNISGNGAAGSFSVQNGTLNTVNTLFLGGYGGGVANRSIALQQIVNASTANQYLFLNGGLGSTSAVNAPTLTSAIAPAFGLESNDAALSILTAAAGTNVAPIRALSVVSSGNVGIGTTNPGAKLDVQGGNINTSGNITAAGTQVSITGINPVYSLGASSFGQLALASSAGNYSTSAGANDLVLRNMAAGGNIILQQGAGAAQFYLQGSTGYIGIGTSSPISQLSNTSTNFISVNGYGVNQGGGLTMRANGAGFVGDFYNAGAAGSHGLLVGTADATSSTAALSVETGGSSRFLVRADGNVGIGTSTPTEKLQVAGNIRLGGGNYLYVPNDSPASIIHTSRSDNTQTGDILSNGWGQFYTSGGFGVGGNPGASSGSLYVANNTGLQTLNPQQALTLGSSASFATNLATPGTPTLTTATTGGTLAAGTYYYKVTALSGSGETIPSAEASITTTGTTSTVTVSWPAVTGAASYRVYRGTAAGAENTYYTSTTTSFTDTGAAGTAASPPTVTTAYVNMINSNGNSYFNGGYVGVGTSNPTALFQVGNSLGHFVQVIPNIAVADYYMNEANPRWSIATDLIGSGRSAYALAQAGQALHTGGVALGVADVSTLGLYTSNGTALTERLRIDGAGNVGIGTTAPTARLNVGGADSTNAASLLVNATLSRQNINLLGTQLQSTLNPGNTFGAVGQYNAVTVQADAGKTLPFYKGIEIAAPVKTGTGTITDAYQMFINAPGSIGSNSNYGLYVAGGANVLNGATAIGMNSVTSFSAMLTVNTNPGDNRTAFRIYQDDTTNNNTAAFIRNSGTGASLKIQGAGTSEQLTLTGSGQLGLGTATPSQKLHVYNGNALVDLGNLQLTNQAAPTTAPTVAVNTTAGNLSGSYYYVVTFVTGQGETSYGPVSAAVAPAAQQVNLSAIPTGPSGIVTARKIYRTTANTSSPYFLVTTINDNATTTYTDNLTDASLGVGASKINRAGGTISLNGTPIVVSDFAGANLGLGPGTLSANTTGTYNTAVGRSAFQSNTTGNYNTALGMNALFSNTSGSFNTAVGLQALYSNTTGGSNSAVGWGSLNSNTTGYSNAALGDSALYSNTTGYSNTAVGRSALQFNTTGSSNAALGYNALYSNTSGFNNTALGINALYSNTTGSSNAALGQQALYSNTTGSYNTALGQQAGNSNSTGSGNVFLGYQAGFNETGNNKLYIANSSTSTPLLYGDFGAGTLTVNGAQTTTGNLVTNGTLRVYGSGWSSFSDRLGVGTTTPYAQLHVLAPWSTSSTPATWQPNVIFDTASGTGLGQAVVDLRIAGTHQGSIRYDGNGNVVFQGSGVNGAVYLNYDEGKGGVIVGSPSNTNNVTVYGTASTCQIGNTVGGVTCASDARLKTNVQGLANALEGIMNLRPVTFNWIDPSRPQDAQIGLIAQDVQKLFPQFVHTIDPAGHIGVDYAGLITPTIAAIQQQQKEIVDLQNSLSGGTANLNVGSVTASRFQGSTASFNQLNLSGRASVGSLQVSGDAQFNGSVSVAGPVAVQGDLTVAGLTRVANIEVGGQIISRGNAPALAAGSAVGTNPTGQPAPAVTVEGTDGAGTLTLNTGSTPGAPGVLAELTFTKPYAAGTTFKVALTPVNSSALDLRIYVEKTATGFRLVTRDKPAAGATYSFDYLVMGAQQVVAGQ